MFQYVFKKTNQPHLAWVQYYVPGSSTGTAEKQPELLLARTPAGSVNWAGKEGTASSVWTLLGSSDSEAALMKNKDPLGHSEPASCQTAHLIKVESAFSSSRTSLLWGHLLLQMVSGSDESAGAVRWTQFRWLTPVFLPGKFHGQTSLVGYSPWGYKGRTWLSTHTHTHTPRRHKVLNFFLQ